MIDPMIDGAPDDGERDPMIDGARDPGDTCDLSDAALAEHIAYFDALYGAEAAQEQQPHVVWPEEWTSGLVSRAARDRWLHHHPDGSDASFVPERTARGRVWRMTGWSSSIARCRAMGRGWASGGGEEPHWADLLVSDWERAQ